MSSQHRTCCRQRELSLENQKNAMEEKSKQLIRGGTFEEQTKTTEIIFSVKSSWSEEAKTKMVTKKLNANEKLKETEC